MKNSLINISYLTRAALLLCILLLISGEMWGAKITLNGYSKLEETTSEGVRFYISGRKDTYTQGGVSYGYTAEGKTMTIQWTVPDGYILSVTGVKIKSREQKYFTQGKSYYKSTRKSSETRINSENKWSDVTFDASYFPLGKDSSVSVRADKHEYQYENVEITYTITPKTYTITLDGEGGTGHSANVTLTFDSNSHAAITNPSKDGCSFQGWYSGDNGTGSLIIDASGNLQANTVYTGAGGVWKKDSTGISLHAKWSGVPYSVRFNGNGSTAGNMSNQALEYGTAQNLKANAFEKTCTVTYNANGGSCGITSSTTNFGFAGWATTSDGSVAYANGAEVENLTSTSGAVVDLYAKWAAVADTIVLPIPTKDGYVFLGWYNSSNVLVGDAGGPYTPSGNETLEARWVQALTSTVNKSTLLGNFDEDAKSISWSTEHVTFTLQGDGLKKETWLGTTYFYLYANDDKTWQYDLTWTVDSKDAGGNSAYTINVKKVTFDIERASGLGTYMTIEGRRSGNIYANGNIPSGGISSGTLSKGENETVTTHVETSDIFYSNIVLNNVTVIYTLEPIINMAPEQSVEVTLCDASKQLLNLSTCASLADQSGHVALNYSLIGANAAHAHITGDNKFYADIIDTYRVRASVDAVADCHSDNAVEFTINVTPATLALTAPTASDITYPATLASSTLTGGSAMVGSCEVEGTWAWQNSATRPSVGDGQSFPVVFTPSENASYYTNFVTNATVNVLAFIFTGEGDDDEQANVWVKDDNWNVDATPTIDNVVIIRHDVIVEDEVSAYSVEIEDGYTLTIAPNGGLTVGAGGIIGATKSNLILKADADAKSATKGKTGYLRISPAYTGAMPQATVELYSKAYYDYDDKTDNIAKWQYVGSPLASTDVMAKTVYTTSWIYSWNEGADKWFNERKTLKFTPFVGYATTQRTYPDGILLSYTGQLVSNQGKHDIDLAWSDEDHGYNAIANSFAAPIDITKFSDEDFFHADSVVYIFNTGSRSQAMAAAAQKSSSVNTPGQFLAIPIGSIRMLKKAFDEMPTTIASMQGFFVHALAEDARVTMEYDKLVWNGDYGKNPNVPIRAPKLRDDADDEVLGALQISLFSDMGGDHLFMLESEQFNSLYENGIDARKLMGDALNIFSVAGNDQLAVDATNSIIGTRVGVRTGEETAYTIVFNNLRSENELALLDNETEQTIDIEEGVEYTFFAEPNTVIADRFMIVERDNADKPGVTTGIEQTAEASKVHKFIQSGKLFILKNGVLYDAMGNVVR